MRASVECSRMRRDESEACARLVSASFGRDARVPRRDTRVAREAGVVQGLVCVRLRRMGFGGRFVRAACVSSLCVAERERGRGIGTQLLASVLQAAFARGAGAAVLIPRSAGLYARLGFACCGTRSRAEFDRPTARALAPAAQVRAFRSGDEPAWRALAVLAARARTAVVVPSRADRERRARPPRRTLVLERDGALAASITLSDVEEEHARMRYVHELFALDRAAAAVLWDTVVAADSDARRVHWRVAPEDPLAALAQAAGARFRSRGPWMLRLLDAQRFLAARGYRRGAGAEFAFALDDPQFVVNTRPFVLSVDGGRGRVHAGGGGSIRADVASFARLCTGAASATELAREGSLAASATELERLDALFALPPAMLQSLP